MHLEEYNKIKVCTLISALFLIVGILVVVLAIYLVSLTPLS